MMKDRMEELLNLLEGRNAEGEGGQTWTDTYMQCGQEIQENVYLQLLLLLFILFVSH